jgi:muconate cycloisomerase
VRYSGVIATADLDDVRETAVLMRKFGVSAVKVKVVADLDTNRRILEIAREIFGDAVELRLDANCVWSGEEALRQLEVMADYRLAGVEQPVPAADLAGLRAVTSAGIVPVVADESLCSLDDADVLIRERACDVFNIRISKCGGLINAGRMHRRAIEAGLACQLGAQVGETGILSAAGRHYATRCAPVRWLEGSYGGLLLEIDLVEPDVTIGPGGHAPALDGPGHGVVPIEEHLARYRVDVVQSG